MQTVPKVAAVCVNWNGGDFLGPALESLLASDYPCIEVLVVDNASSDGSASRLPAGVGLLRLEENAGYGEALNRGMEYLEKNSSPPGPGFFLALNNDVILEPDTVSSLVAFAAEKGPGIFGPAIVRLDDPARLEAAWGELTWSHVLTRLRGKNAPADSSPWNRPAENVILLGSLLLIHRGVFDAGIRFDPNFFMYHEEVDFMHQAARKGFPTFYIPWVRARHHIGMGTRGDPLKKIYWTRRNSIYFLKKEKAGPGKWLRCLASMAGSFLWSAGSLRFGRAGAVAAGALDGLRGIREHHPERKI